MQIVANFVAEVGVIACFVGVFFTTVYAIMVTGHLMGQLGKSAKQS